MNKQNLNVLIKQLLEQKLIGPDFFEILSVSFSHEQIYIYLKLQFLKISEKVLLNELPKYNSEMLKKVCFEINNFIDVYCDDSVIRNLFEKNDNGVFNDVSPATPIIGRK